VCMCVLFGLVLEPIGRDSSPSWVQQAQNDGMRRRRRVVSLQIQLWPYLYQDDVRRERDPVLAV